MDKIKIAVVGTGSIGISHLIAIDQSEVCELRVVCDINEKIAKEFGEQYKVSYCTDYKEIALMSDVDAVILNLPHWLHCEVTEFFLNSGKHVLVEKPMANTVEECDRMIAASEKNGKKLAVGHVQRYFMANRLVKEICQSGQLGKLCLYEEYRSVNYFDERRPKWFLDKKLSGGGIVMNYGAHAFDKLFYILDCDPKEIWANVDNIKNSETIEGHAQILAKFENDVSAAITFCGYVGSGYEARYYFTEGTLKVVDGMHLYQNDGKDGWKEIHNIEDGEFMKRQLEGFCALIRGESTDIPTGKYGKKVIQTIAQIYD